MYKIACKALAVMAILITASGMLACQTIDGRNPPYMNAQPVKSNNPAIQDEPPQIKTEKSMFTTAIDFFWGDESRTPQAPLGPFMMAPETRPEIPADKLNITWLGHSSMLIEMGGKRFLTDPVWSRRCSPISFIGPERFFDVPISLENLPRIDGVLISHDHYDHLDKATITHLSKHQNTPFYVPMGVGRHLRDWHVPEHRIREFKWWDEIYLDNTHTLALTPTQHFSGRGLFDRNKTLWASWVIIGPDSRVYFGGDSGLFPGFKAIGDKYGPFDVTMLEIGAFDPAWADIHMGPENAVKAHKMLRGKTLLPIHWGTFNLALHPWTEPVETLISESQKNGVDLLIPKPGTRYSAPNLTSYATWWRDNTQKDESYFSVNASHGYIME